jgi:hypothetical protein
MNATPGAPAREVGSHGDYQWLSMDECDISTLLRLCPDVVLGKYLAVTSIDSGSLRITDQEKNDGWWTSEAAKVFTATSWNPRDYGGKVAYSPKLTSIHGLPNETHDECCGGFNEWYIFEQSPPATEMEVFVNWGGFSLCDSRYQEWADRFWEQLTRFRPESYIAQGTGFTFVARKRDLFECVRMGLAPNP